MNDGSEAGAGAAGRKGVERVVLVTVTYLEMTSPDQRSVPPEWAEPTTILRAERPTISFYRYLYDTVGADWDWFERRRLSDEALAAIIHDDAVEVFVLYVRGVPAGYVELDRRVEHELEVAYFGLVPDYVGRGFGPCCSAGRSNEPGATVLAGYGSTPARSTTPRRFRSTGAPDSRCTTAGCCPWRRRSSTSYGRAGGRRAYSPARRSDSRGGR